MASALGIAYSMSTSSATTHYSSAVSSNGTPRSPRSEYSAASSSGSLVGDSLQDADDGKSLLTVYERYRAERGQKTPLSPSTAFQQLLTLSKHPTRTASTFSPYIQEIWLMFSFLSQRLEALGHLNAYYRTLLCHFRYPDQDFRNSGTATQIAITIEFLGTWVSGKQGFECDGNHRPEPDESR
jgi:hypothetical protein